MMGFTGFGKPQKAARKFDLDAIFEKTKREAKTILSHNGNHYVTCRVYLSVSVCVCLCACACSVLCMYNVKDYHIAPRDDDTSEGDDDMLIGPPISLAQPATTTTAHVSQIVEWRSNLSM